MEIRREIFIFDFSKKQERALTVPPLSSGLSPPSKNFFNGSPTGTTNARTTAGSWAAEVVLLLLLWPSHGETWLRTIIMMCVVLARLDARTTLRAAVRQRRNAPPARSHQALASYYIPGGLLAISADQRAANDNWALGGGVGEQEKEGGGAVLAWSPLARSLGRPRAHQK